MQGGKACAASGNSRCEQFPASRATASSHTLIPVGLLLVFLVLQACTKVGPDFETIAAPTQDNWIDRPAEPFAGEPEDLATWWQVFDEPILTELIQTAYKQNLTLQAAGLRVLEARA